MAMHRRHPLGYALAVIMVFAMVGAQAQTVLRVGAMEAVRPYFPLLTALYQEIGLTPVFVDLPPERSLRNVESGDLDADLGRAAGSTQGYRNMVETQEMLIPIRLNAIVRKGFPVELSATNLATYRVGHMRGIKLAETFCKQHGLTPMVGNSVEGRLKMLVADRLDVMLLTSGTPLSMYPGHEDAIVTQAKPLQVIKAVHVFNARWADYAPRFDAAVRAFRADGRYVKLLPAQP
mgnify:FL=1